MWGVRSESPALTALEFQSKNCWTQTAAEIFHFPVSHKGKKQQLGLKRLSWFKWVSDYFYTYLQFHRQSAAWGRKKDSQLSILVKKTISYIFCPLTFLSPHPRGAKHITAPRWHTRNAIGLGTLGTGRLLVLLQTQAWIFLILLYGHVRQKKVRTFSIYTLATCGIAKLWVNV